MPLAGLLGGCQLHISKGLGAAAQAGPAPSSELKELDLCASRAVRAMPSYVPVGQGIGPVWYTVPGSAAPLSEGTPVG